MKKFGLARGSRSVLYTNSFDFSSILQGRYSVCSCLTLYVRGVLTLVDTSFEPLNQIPPREAWVKVVWQVRPFEYTQHYLLPLQILLAHHWGMRSSMLKHFLEKCAKKRRDVLITDIYNCLFLCVKINIPILFVITYIHYSTSRLGPGWNGKLKHDPLKADVWNVICSDAPKARDKRSLLG